MYTATAGIVLPTTITGSLPRPGWYTENLGRRSFREAMVDRTYREQYLDAASAYIRDQELAGLDIVTDGDCRFDADVGGHNWFSYAPIRMDGFSDARAYRKEGGRAGFVPLRGHILHDILEACVMPDFVGLVGRGTLQFTAVWRAAQRLTPRPVKFGTITPELVAMAVRDFHYKDLRKAIMAVSEALNEELRELVDAGCQVVQMEEPQIHMLAAKGAAGQALDNGFLVEVFNNTVRGLRAKEVERFEQMRPEMESDSAPINPLRLCKEIDGVLDDDTIVIGDGGDFVATAASVLRIAKIGQWLDPGPLGTLGVGPGYAMAAKLARPGSNVIIVYGDGAFGLNGLEYEAFVRQKINVVGVIGNDAAWMQIRRGQVEFYGEERSIATKLDFTRYDQVVEALGGHGEYVEEPRQIRPALERALGCGKPAVVNVRLGVSEFRKGAISI